VSWGCAAAPGCVFGHQASRVWQRARGWPAVPPSAHPTPRTQHPSLPTPPHHPPW
jgi:hypothetical protein